MITLAISAIIELDAIYVVGKLAYSQGLRMIKPGKGKDAKGFGVNAE
jgi:hypothetical protein